MIACEEHFFFFFFDIYLSSMFLSIILTFAIQMCVGEAVHIRLKFTKNSGDETRSQRLCFGIKDFYEELATETTDCTRKMKNN